MLLLLACHAPEPEPKPEPSANVHAANGRVYDPDGRALLLRGVNARIEGIFDVSFDDGRVALETIPPFGEEDCRFLAEALGLNALRLPVNWSGIEPEAGQYNEDYLARITTLVDACAAQGVSSIVDLHQDAYSKEIGEDGAPLWAIVPAPEELLEGPLTDLGTRRTSPAVLAAFGSLYGNASGLTDAYAAMAAHLAASLADHPGAIALELQNEPVPLGRLDDLDAFHAAVAGAVREVAPDLMLAFEPDSFRNLTDAATVNTPFPYPNALYVPHTYVDVFEDTPGSAEAIAASVAGVVTEAKAHSATPWIGEFGADPNTEEGRRYVEDCLAVFDQQQMGWAFWVYEEWGQGQWGLFDSDGDARGAAREEILTLLARPYPIAIHGDVQEQIWDGATLHLTVLHGDTGEQVVSAPTRIWPQGPKVRCDGEEVEVTAAGGRATFRCAGSLIDVY